MSRPPVLSQVTVDPSQIDQVIDTHNVGWEDVLFAIIILAAAFLVARVARRLVARYLRRYPEVQPGLATFLGRVVGWAIILVGFVLALTAVGVQTGPLIIAILIIGIVLVLSGRPLLENFGAGVVLQVRTPFRVGEEVEVGGTTGTVIDIDGRTVVIDTPDGKRVHIPNSDVLGQPITNRSTRGALRSDITVGVEYGTDLERARSVLTEAVAAVDGVFDDPAPEIFVNDFADSSIDIAVWFWHEPTILEGFVITDEVTRAIMRALLANGIVIAFPQRTLWRGEDRDRHDR